MIYFNKIKLNRKYCPNDGIQLKTVITMTPSFPFILITQILQLNYNNYYFYNKYSIRTIKRYLIPPKRISIKILNTCTVSNTIKIFWFNTLFLTVFVYLIDKYKLLQLLNIHIKCAYMYTLELFNHVKIDLNSVII